MTRTDQRPADDGGLAQEELDALGYAPRPDETTDEPDRDRPVTPDHSDYGDDYDYPVLEIHHASGVPVEIGASAGHEPVAFAVADQDDALEAMRAISLVLAPAGRVRARLHFAPEDFDVYEIGSDRVESIPPR